MLQELCWKHEDFSVVVMLDPSRGKVHQDVTGIRFPLKIRNLGRPRGPQHQALGRVERGGIAIVNEAFCVSEHGSISALDTIRGLVGGRLVLVDKAYDSNAIRACIEERRSFAVIPLRANRKKHIPYDKAFGKNRDRSKNFFEKIKRFRRIGTRYDELPETYQGFVKLFSLTEWIRFDFVHTA